MKKEAPDSEITESSTPVSFHGLLSLAWTPTTITLSFPLGSWFSKMVLRYLLFKTACSDLSISFLFWSTSLSEGKVELWMMFFSSTATASLSAIIFATFITSIKVSLVSFPELLVIVTWSCLFDMSYSPTWILLPLSVRRSELVMAWRKSLVGSPLRTVFSAAIWVLKAWSIASSIGFLSCWPSTS